MIPVRFIVSCLWVLSFLFLMAFPVSAQPPVTLSGKYARPHQVLPVAAQPLAGPLQALTNSITGAAQPGAPAEETNTEPQETFGTKALGFLIDSAATLRSETGEFIDNFAVLSQLSSWLTLQSDDPRLQGRWRDVGINLFSVVGMAFVVALLLELLFFPARRALGTRKPAQFTGRLVTALGLLGLRVLPVLLFISLALSLLNWGNETRIVRFIILNVVYALALNRLVVVGWRFLFAPRAESLRLISATASQALYAYHWLCAFTLVIIYGYFCIDLARGIRVPEAAITAFGNLLGLAFVIMAIWVVIQKRAFVSVFLRKGLSAARSDLTLRQSSRLWFARRWHVLAISYLVIGYLVTALGVENGVMVMLRGTILSLLILVVVRLLLHLLDRWSARVTTGPGFHRAILRFPFQLTISTGALTAVAASWGVDILGLVATPVGQRITGAALSIGTTVMIVVLLYEAFNAAVERHLSRRDKESNEFRASARARTLLPMMRNTAVIFFSIIVVFVVLSEMGVNIGPLLAGAGVIGVAIGFGSQALVKDLLTGLFIVLDNTVTVGDVVKIGDASGVVERMSVRNIHLRGMDGAVHILPFSDVTRVINMTRDFSYAVVDIGVAYESDLEHVMDVMRAVGEELRQDPLFKYVILEPIEILGIEKMGDFSITLRSRIRTRPAKQWDVKRMFLLRLKQRFDKEGIEIPYPTTISLKKGSVED